MAGGELLGHGRIVVEVEENVSRDLQKVEQKVEKTMKKIERERASIKLDANLAPLQKKVQEAEDKIKKYRAEASKNAELGLSTKNAQRRLKEWEGKLNERREVRDSVKLDTAEARRQLAKLRRLEEREHEATLELADARQDAFQAVEKARTQAAQDAARERRQIAEREVAEQKARLDELQRAEKRASDARAAARKRVKLDEPKDDLEAMMRALSGATEAWEDDADAVAAHTRVQEQASEALDEYNRRRRVLNATEEETNVLLGRQKKAYSEVVEMVKTSDLTKFREYDRSALDDMTQAGRTREEYDRLKADIEANGIQSPIILNIDRVGNTHIGEGNHRLAIAKELGIQDVPVRVVISEKASAGKTVKMSVPQTRADEYRPSDIGLASRKVSIDDLAAYEVRTAAQVAAEKREIELSAERASEQLQIQAAREQREREEAAGQKMADAIEAQRRASLGKMAEIHERALRADAVRDKKRAEEYERDWAKAHQENADRAEKAARDYASDWEEAHRHNDKLTLASWKRMLDMETAAERAGVAQKKAAYEAATANERHAMSVAQLNRQYIEAARQLRRLRNTKTPFQAEKRQKLELDTAVADAQLARMATEIRALGGIEPTIKFNYDKGFRAKLDNTVRKGLDSLQNIGNVAVRVGPFTSSLAGLTKAMIVLGPVVTSLVGSLSALVGVTGAGLVGAMTVAGGAMTGFGLAAAGMFMAIKPVVGEISNATKAAAAYDKAVREHGKGSDQAAKKLEVFNNVMKNQSAEAKRNYLAAGNMTEAWAKATEPSRTAAFNTMGRGLKFATDNMGWFAQRTNTATQAVSGGLVKWMDRLSSSTGRGVLTGIFDSFNRSLPNIMAGLGNLGAYLGKVFQVGAKEGEGMFQTFERWSDRLNKGFNPEGIRRIVGYSKDLGNFLLAAGRTLRAFFGIGAREGSTFLKDMTAGLDRWTASMEGPGARKMQAFFHDARENTQALWTALGPIAGQFLTWATSLAPFVTMLLQGAGVATQIVASFLRMVEGIGNIIPGVEAVNKALFGTSNVASTLLATMGLLWATGKAAAFATVVMKGASALRSMAVAMGLVKAASAGGALMGLGGAAAGGAATGFAAKLAAARVALTGTAAAAATTTAATTAGASAMAAYGAAATGTAAATGVAATAATGLAVGTIAATAGVGLLAVGAGVLAYKLLKGKEEADKMRDSVSKLAENNRLNANAFDKAGQNVNKHNSQFETARAGYRAAVKELKSLKEGTEAWDRADKRRYDNLVRMRNATQDRRTDANAQRSNAAQGLASSEQRAADARKINADKIAQAQRALKDAMDDTSGPASVRLARVSGIQAELDALLAQRAAAVKNAESALAAARNRRAAATLNVMRAEKNMDAVTGKNAQKLGALARQPKGKAVAQTIALKYKSPDNVGAVSAAASRALKSGIKQSVVMKVLADTKTAEGAIKRLTRMDVEAKMLKVGLTGDNGVMSKLSKIDQKAIKKKIARIIEQGGNPTIDTINRIIQKQIRNKNFKIQAEVGQALANINLMQSGLSRIQSKSILISAKKIGDGWDAGGRTDPKATGGAHGPGAKMLARAYTSAMGGGSRKTNGGVYRNPTLLVGEENKTEYVIATNPAYRKRNLKFLRSAANELGAQVVDPNNPTNSIDAAPKGRQPMRHTRPKSAKDKKRTRRLDVPKKIAEGGVPLEEVEAPYKKADAEVKKREKKIAGLETRKAREITDLKDMKRRKNEKGGKFSERVKKQQRYIEKIRDEIDFQTRGEFRGGKQVTESLSDLKRKRKNLKDRYDAVKKISEDIAEQRSQANRFQSEMSVASTMYSKYGDEGPKGKNAKGVVWSKVWEDARTAREGALLKLKDHYDKAAGAATMGTPFHREMQELAASTTDERTTSVETEALAGPEPVTVSLEEFITGQKRMPELLNLRNAEALARYNTPRNEKDLAGSLADDITAATNTKNFYEGIYEQFKNDPNIPTYLKTEMIDAATTAREALDSINNDISGGPNAESMMDPATVRDTARYEAMRAFGSNSAALSFSGDSGAGYMRSSPTNLMDPATTGGPDMTSAYSMSAPGTGRYAGSTGAGGEQAGPTGTTVTVNNTFATVPPDPHTWSAGVSYELGGIV